jgi:uncharacterized protein YidB (DUF937 family)
MEELMSFFDNSLSDAVPGGNLATPIAIAAGALLLHHFFGGSKQQAPAPEPYPQQGGGYPQQGGGYPQQQGGGYPQQDGGNPQQGGGGFLEGGGLLGGLSGLVNKLTQAGAGNQVNSWVANGPNQPIDPSHLGNALGPDVLSQLSARTGLNQQQLIEGLAQVLPQLVHNLTPNGRLPTQQEAQYTPQAGAPWGR